MDKRQEIIERFQAFNEYLESINLDELKKDYTRTELNELKSELRNINLRSLSYDIGQVTQAMKEEEYPELLGVHHFPVIKQIEFLTDKQKLALDEFLLKHRVGNYVSGLWRITGEEKKRIQLEAWLLEHDVIEENYSVLCPTCYDGWISSSMSKKEKEELDTMLKNYKKTPDWEVEEKIMERLQHGCMECESDFELDNDTIDRLKYKTLTKMKMKRDTSLDNV